MAGYVWFSVIVLISIQHVFARDCSNVESILNCNECIRCGGYWCNRPMVNPNVHCVKQRSDDWCPDDQETLMMIKDVKISGKTIDPIYSERTVYVDIPNRIPIGYVSTREPKINITIVNTTQNFDFAVTNKTKCKGDKCTTTIEAKPGKDFCSPIGRSSEFVHVKVNVEDIKEDVSMKYHVPCACECSEKVEKNSKWCNGNGDYSCGVCSCKNGWNGEYCDKKDCETRRGDLQCSNPARNDVECSGNGYCGPCETCECYTDRIGSQYFDKDNYCADICMIANNCDECLRNSTLGQCDQCPMVLEAYNETFMGERDYLNRTVWVRCNDTFVDDCYIEYAAKKDENNNIHVMVINSCEMVNAVPVTRGIAVTVPVVLGVIALLAAAAAVAGFMMWKNRPPPMPLTDPEYQNIDAEDCTGENPLYKPPTSSFKNPTYGKW